MPNKLDILSRIYYPRGYCTLFQIILLSLSEFDKMQIPYSDGII